MKTVVSKDGTKIAYETLGTGPALIYVTGATCHRRFFPIRHDAKEFARSFTVYNYDRRGRGDSGDTLPYHPQREVEDLEALIDAAGGAAYVYGHSSGAVVGLEAALALEQKVKGLVVYDTPYVHDEAARVEYGEVGARVRNHLARGEQAKALRAFLTGIGMPKLFGWLLPLFPGWKTLKALAPTLAYDIELTRDLPPVERLRGITGPVRILIGEKSPSSMRTVAESLRDSVTDSVFEVVPGADHMVSAKVLRPLLWNAWSGENPST